MIKINKRLKALEEKVRSLELCLEKITKSTDFSHGVEQKATAEQELSYKEVLDQWLNGKTN